MTPTPEQTAIVEAAVNTTDNLLIKALAGAAKTSTLVLIAETLRKTTILCISFNKKIADEMKARLPSNCTSMTLNSMGHRVWSDTIGKRLTLNTKKNYEILTALMDQLDAQDREDLFESFGDMLKAIESGKTAGYIPDGRFPRAKPLMSDAEFFEEWLDIDFTDLQRHLILEATAQSISRGLEGIIDFNDQILLPTCFPSSFPQFPLVLVDESQDLSALNHRMIQKFAKKRIIAVGDECQPAGTLVSVVERLEDRWNARKIKQVPIEELKVGDRLVGYDTTYSEFMFNRKVEGITARPFTGRLVKVITPQGTSKYTPNHHCFANFSRLRNHTALYLMRFGSRWRIGVAAMDYKQSSGPIARARVEGADAMWILATFPTKQEALAAEATVQAAYGIPDITFQWAGVHTNGYHAPDVLKSVWNRLDNVDFTPRAHDLLRDFNREPDYPFWKQGQKYGTVKRPMVVHACNLLPGGEVLPFTGKKKEKLSDWQDYELRYEEYEGLVYSLTVSHNHLYVADGLVTHNCQAIYGFRGAHQDSMEQLRKTFEMKTFVLSISFRCPISVVEAARWRAPHMQWPEWAKPGDVIHLQTWTGASLPPADVAIICRNNAPLFKQAIRLIKAGRYPKLVGNDIGKNLLKIMNKFGKPDLPIADAEKKLERWVRGRLKKARDPAPIEDQADCIRVFFDEAETLGDAVRKAEHLFSMSGPIELLTGHKSKGLEFEHVFFLDADLCKDKGQDRNLRYVIITRAKQTLTYVTTEGWME